LVTRDLQQTVAQEQRAGALGALLLFWSLGSFIGVEAGLGWLWWLAIALGVAIVVGAITNWSSALGTLFAVVLLIAWPITLAVLLNDHSSKALATHVVQPP
jgi:uncharacterized membrane protein